MPNNANYFLHTKKAHRSGLFHILSSDEIEIIERRLRLGQRMLSLDAQP